MFLLSLRLVKVKTYDQKFSLKSYKHAAETEIFRFYSKRVAMATNYTLLRP